MVSESCPKHRRSAHPDSAIKTSPDEEFTAIMSVKELAERPESSMPSLPIVQMRVQVFAKIMQDAVKIWVRNSLGEQCFLRQAFAGGHVAE